jgi:S1-C subfamily serine protease
VFEVHELPDELPARVRSRPKGRSREPREEPERRSNLIVILAVAFGVIGMGVAGYFALKKEDPKETVAADPPKEEVVPPPAPVKELSKKDEPPKKVEPKKEEPKLPTPEEIVRRVKDATVYIRTTVPGKGVGTGTGFFAGRPGFVVTNAHVVGYGPRDVRPPSKVEVIIDSGEANERTLSAKVYGVDVESDLALLQVEVKAEGTRLPTPLPFGRAEELVETQDVVIYGYPFGELLGKNVSVNRSSVSSLRKEDGKLRLIQLAGGLNPGNSGGPVTNAKGAVIGVSVAKLQGAETIGFAIPAEEADTFVKDQHRVGGRFETGSLVVVGPAPVRPPIRPPVRPPVAPPVNPPQPAAVGKEVKLPGAATAVVVGGSGRFICLHLPNTRQVAVFDANEGKVVKYLPVGGNKVLMAAGAENLFVVLPDDNVIQRGI